jgi:hypothetical protein
MLSPWKILAIFGILCVVIGAVLPHLFYGTETGFWLTDCSFSAATILFFFAFGKRKNKH